MLLKRYVYLNLECQQLKMRNNEMLKELTSDPHERERISKYCKLKLKEQVHWFCFLGPFIVTMSTAKALCTFFILPETFLFLNSYSWRKSATWIVMVINIETITLVIICPSNFSSDQLVDAIYWMSHVSIISKWETPVRIFKIWLGNSSGLKWGRNWYPFHCSALHNYGLFERWIQVFLYSWGPREPVPFLLFSYSFSESTGKSLTCSHSYKNQYCNAQKHGH